MASIKIRAKAKDGVTTVKTLISHPMESGLRKDSKTGELIPAHHVTEVTAEHKGSTVMTGNWSGESRMSDKTKKESDSAEAKIK